MTESTAMRPQPPSIKDPPSSDFEFRGGVAGLDTETPGALMDESDSGRDRDADPSEHDDFEDEEPNWLQRGKDAYRFSTSWIDTNFRRKWEDGIRAFQSQHPADSKYNADVFRKRSNLFVPRTRSIIRKNEAALAAALFSNVERINVTPENGNDRAQRIGAELMQAILQHRLTKSLPWFTICMGAAQDSQVQGAVIGHWYWHYSTRKNANGQIVRAADRPACRLVPIENFLFDPASDWMDVVNSSPYLIEKFPMYVVDVRARMNRPDPKGRQWRKFTDRVLVPEADEDTTRRQRSFGAQDAFDEPRPVSDYAVVWIHRHIHRWNGTDYEFYTLRSQHLLTEPEPLETTVFHGIRPYVLGGWQIEAHRTIPASLAEVAKPLQEDINDIKNQRSDNVRFVLNKGYFARRGKNVDLPALVRNVPGRVVLMDDPEKDVVENNWPDVTASAYQEEDRNNQSFDELLGNFSAASIQMARSPREPARSMTMLQAPSTILTEYFLKTLVETWIQPSLRQLVLLEQYYETDDTVFEIAKEKAKMFQKYGLDKVTDDMIEREMIVNVNVGMGATDPTTRLQKFLMGLMQFTKICVRPPPGVDLGEVFKEIMALSGYADGERFKTSQDAEKTKLEQIVKQLQAKLQQLQITKNDRHEKNVVDMQKHREGLVKDLVLAAKEDRHQNVMLYAKHLMAKQMGDQQAEQARATQAQGAMLQPQQQPPGGSGA